MINPRVTYCPHCGGEHRSQLRRVTHKFPDAEQLIADSNNAWLSARSFKDLCNLTIKFLRHEIWTFPGVEALPYEIVRERHPLYGETSQITNELIDLNKNGFWTLFSQPALDEEFRDPSGKYFRLQQRATVVGFTTREKAKRIRLIEKNVKTTSSKHVVITREGNLKAPYYWLDMTWIGRRAPIIDELRKYAIIGEAALRSLEDKVYIQAYDPVWGEKYGFFWATLLAAIEG